MRAASMTRARHDHDRGLQHDLEQIAALKRRRRCSGMLSGTALLIAVCADDGFNDLDDGFDGQHWLHRQHIRSSRQLHHGGAGCR